MSAAAPSSPPTGLLPRFGLLFAAMRWALSEGLYRRRQSGVLEPRLLPLAELLWHYLARTMRRLSALHARFAAGTLPAAPRRGAPPGAAAGRAKSERRPAAIPRGPVLLQYGMGYFVPQLQALLDDPEMRALLAASPQAGRLLRPLWRKLSIDPLPEVLRPPPRPPQPPRPKRPRLARPRQARVAPARPPASPPDAPTLWEPPILLPPWPD